MATGDFFGRISDIITCEICFESFRDKTPRVLTCAHVFCEQCIQRLIDMAAARNPNYDDTLMCPTCKVSTKIPSRQAARLPLFFHSRKVEDILKEFEERHFFCDCCKTDTHLAEVKSYCFTCGHGMCCECRHTHDNCLKDHNCIDVTRTKMNNLICHRHDTGMEYFCVTCQKSICRKCLLNKHKGHNIHNVIYNSEQPSGTMKQWLEERLNEAKLSRTYLDEIQLDIDNNIQAARTELKRHCQALKEYIDQTYESLNIELDNIHHEMNEPLIEGKSHIDKTIRQIEKLIEESRHFNEPVPGVPEGQIGDVENLMSDIKKQIPPTETKIERPQSVRFVPGSEELEIGKIERQGVKSVAEAMADLSIQQSEDRLLRCEDTTLTLTLTIVLEIGVIQDMCFLASGELVVVGRGLVVYNKYGQKIKHHLSEVHAKDEGLCDVCIDYTDNSVHITENRGNKTAGYLHRHRQCGHEWTHDRIEVCREPDKVSVTKDKKIVLSDLNYNLHMYKVSESGQSRHIWRTQMSDFVSSVCVSNENKIVVCVGGMEVCLLDTEGHRLCTLDTGHTQIQPRGVCVDVCDDIVVCDDKSKSLLLYDKNGKFIKNVLSLPCDRPWIVKLLKHKNVVVSDRWRVFVYKM